jgi:CRP/FNR family cyclic AMP-dependent transcriptional regulator
MGLTEWKIFAGLDPDDATQVIAICRRRRYRSGETLMSEADSSSSVFLIDNGHVLIERVSYEGDVTVVALRGPGDVVGESALILPDQRRGASVRAIMPVDTLILGRADFDQLREQRPSVDRFLVAMLAQRNRALSTQLHEQRNASVPDRVRRVVARLAATFGDTIPLPQHVIASLAGTTRATANPVLRSLEADGFIELFRSRIEVRDRSVIELLDQPI